MMIAYLTVFLVSLAGIIALFAFKYAEGVTGRTIMPQTRQLLDKRTLALRSYGAFVARIIEHLPALSVAFCYFSLHMFAVLVALAARTAEHQAHQLADSVSHRRRFQRRETQSAFLQQVSKHKETLVVPPSVLHPDKE